MPTIKSYEMVIAATSQINEHEIAAAFSNDLLHLIILPTENCNFRCVYCYEDFSIGTMKPPVIAGIKRLLAQRIPTLRQLRIAWFGGEPLIALKVIEEISGFAQTLTKQVPGVAYSSEMTTNGYLLNLATAERLQGLGIRHYQVSLDGPEELHDQTRVQRNGGGSFQQIWTNLLRIRSSSLAISVLLRIHLTPSNLSVMPDFLHQLRQELLTDRRFTVLFKAVGRWGGPQDDTMEVLEEPEATLAIKRLKGQHLQGIEEDSLNQPQNVCYASRPNSFVIRASGDIGKCTVALSDPANNIGRLLENGTLELRNEALRPWLRGWMGADVETLGCPLLGLPRETKQPVLLQIGARPIPAKQGNGEPVFRNNRRKM
jgi:uncharacterized protein